MQAYQSPSLVHILKQLNAFLILMPRFFNIHFNIILISMQYLQICLFTSCFLTRIYYSSFISSMCVTCPPFLHFL